MIRVRFKALVRIWADTAQKFGLYTPDDTLEEIVADGYTKEHGGVFSAVSAGSESLGLGDVSAVKGLTFDTDNAFTVAINGGTGIHVPCVTLPTGEKRAAWAIMADISSLSITASDGDVNGRYRVWGT